MDASPLTHLVPRSVTTERGDVLLRPAELRDAGPVARMHARCSTETVFRRYFSAIPAISPTVQAKLLCTRLSLVAEHGHEVVGLANLADHPGRPLEIAVLVEDAWQRRGIGLALAEACLDVAVEWGEDRVVAYTLHSSGAAHAMLRRVRGGTLHPQFHRGEDGLVETVLPLPAPVPEGSMDLSA